MPHYNLNALGSTEFERLCQSLVQKIIGSGAKIYGMGSNGARDATFEGKANYPSDAEQWDGRWIIQVKFHDEFQLGPKKAREKLLEDLNNELSTITKKYKYPCDNYILATNISLTPVYQKGTKDKINNEIVPKYRNAIKNIDVWGKEEICRFLDSHIDIRQTYMHLITPGDIIAYLLNMIKREETILDEIVKLYCQGCYHQEKYAVLDDAGDVDDKPVELQHLFIDLDIRPQELPKDKRKLEKLPEWLRQASEYKIRPSMEFLSIVEYRPIRSSALSFLFDDSILNLVIIGGPGEGKSTLIQYLAQIHRAYLIGRSEELVDNEISYENFLPRIPFRILLKEYAEWVSKQKNSDDLFHYISSEMTKKSGRDVKANQIHKIIKSNPILLLLDGLDEVPEKILRDRILLNITTFVNQVRDVHKCNLRVIATTRPYGYSEEFDPTHYLHLNLEKLTHEKSNEYANQWINTRIQIFKEKERVLDTFNTCLKDQVVKILTHTPLQVTILLVIIRAYGTPPKQREELFESYVETIYRREQKKSPELLRTEREVIYDLHKYIAYILHKRAETDETAALINVSDFEKIVKRFLQTNNPLLNKNELENKVKQLIMEARQRLVLIESPEESRIGFSLTSMREFFAAAYLLDTAVNTQEREIRFRAMAKSPHWRNVVLFYAGRFGRIIPGEAPNMIDICREIDLNSVDVFLKRGAQLVIEMVDDRVFRKRQNEISAIQYGITLIDTGYIKDIDNLIIKLQNLNDNYKKYIILPTMKYRLKNGDSKNLEIYIMIYQEIFGIDNFFINGIERASKTNSPELKLLALTNAFEFKITEPWVIKLFEDFSKKNSYYYLGWELRKFWSHVKFYLDFSISSAVKISLCNILIEGVQYERRGFGLFPLEIENELSEFKPEGPNKENPLLFWVLSQILILFQQIYKFNKMNEIPDYNIKLHLPFMTHPSSKEWVKNNKALIKKFCLTFSKEKDNYFNLMVLLLKFMLEPQKFEFYNSFWQLYIKKEIISHEFLYILSKFIGYLPKEENDLHVWYINFCKIYNYSETEENYQKLTSSLVEIMNKESSIVKTHDYKVITWIEYNFDKIIKEFLDNKIINGIKNCLQEFGLSKKILKMCFYKEERMKFIDPNFLKFHLEIIEKKLEKQELLKLDFFDSFYFPTITVEKKFENSIKRIQKIIEQLITNHDLLKELSDENIQELYVVALYFEVIKEKHMVKLYNRINEISSIQFIDYHSEYSKKMIIFLKEMLKSRYLEVAHLAALSLSYIPNYGYLDCGHGPINEKWIVDKIWTFAQDETDNERYIYIMGLSNCNLNWAERADDWFDSIKSSDTIVLKQAWSEVIAEAGYLTIEDRDAYIELLIKILESSDVISEIILSSALTRLTEIIYEKEPIGFDEESLNLPRY